MKTPPAYTPFWLLKPHFFFPPIASKTARRSFRPFLRSTRHDLMLMTQRSYREGKSDDMRQNGRLHGERSEVSRIHGARCDYWFEVGGLGKKAWLA